MVKRMSNRRKKKVSLKVEQFTEEIVHFCVSQCSLHFHMLHHLQGDGLEGGKTEEQFGEPLR